VLKKRRWFIVGTVIFLALLAILLADPVEDWIKHIYAENTPRTTISPASATPDQICLTWSDAPKTSQTIQWRTAPTILNGTVQYRFKGTAETQLLEAAADQTTVNDPLITNDPINHRFTAVLRNLAPATAYEYRVGDTTQNTYSDWAEFTTAPAGTIPFSFIYLGDPQMGFEAWRNLLLQSLEKCPGAAFFVMAGDLVNRGNNRDDWDAFFQATYGILDQRPLVPALGNHEYSRQDNPMLYHNLLALPENGPKTIPAERAYHFTYGNAFFVVLDGNLPPEDQRPWLEEQLSATSATWKFAVSHHPAYSSKSSRDNPEIREYWCDLFDRYHVDMALQGHDHAYMRTPPIRDGKPVASPSEGTIYVISVSGSKFYAQDHHDFAAVEFADTSTYQIIDIETEGGDKLTYRAYDTTGTLRDEVRIEKPALK